MVNSTLSSRGKSAEAMVKAQLARLSLRQSIAHLRFPDARAGSMTPTPSDYLLVIEGRPIFLEVKETAGKTRLPYANFGKDQVGRLRRFALAGAHPLVIIYHSSLKLWRSPDFEIFVQRNEGSGSWELSAFQTFSGNDFLEEILCLQKLRPPSGSRSATGP